MKPKYGIIVLFITLQIHFRRFGNKSYGVRRRYLALSWKEHVSTGMLFTPTIQLSTLSGSRFEEEEFASEMA
jgi:hypothetical protein